MKSILVASSDSVSRRLSSRQRSMIRSSVGAVLAGIYFAVAAFITQDEVRHSAGGWISLRGMLTGIITAPSQFLVAPLLRLIGVPPMHYLASWRMEVAAEKLRNTNASLAQVAEIVGYDSEAAFSRAFKKAFGTAPATWRRSNS